MLTKLKLLNVKLRKKTDQLLSIRRDSMGRNVAKVIDRLELMYGGSWSYVVDNKWYEDTTTGRVEKCYCIKNI